MTFRYSITKMAHANISNMANYICRSTEHRTCVTVIAPNLGITFSHGAHQTLRIGSTLSLYRIKNPDGRMFTGTVARMDASDLILLEINPNIPIPEITFSNPEHGCEYFLLGLSSINQQLYVHSGTVGGIRVSRNGHFFGTSGSSPGDSGGACFDKRNPRRFLGMNVGNWTQPLTEVSQFVTSAKSFHTSCKIHTQYSSGFCGIINSTAVSISLYR